MLRYLLTTACLLSISVAFAQDGDFHRNNIVVGIGPAIPVGSANNYLSTAPLIKVGYGAVYLHYSETVPSNGYYSLSCHRPRRTRGVSSAGE
jgi:hypothetical protein